MFGGMRNCTCKMREAEGQTIGGGENNAINRPNYSKAKGDFTRKEKSLGTICGYNYLRGRP